MELASCHPSGIQNFEDVSRFLENLCTCALGRIFSLSTSGCHVSVIYFMTASYLFIPLRTNVAAY
jgi:hypothetical protein